MLLREVLVLRQRNRKLVAILRLLVALVRVSGFSIDSGRVPDGDQKAMLLRAIERSRNILPVRAALRVLGLSSSRYHAWKRSQETCSLDDRSACPQTASHQLISIEIQTIKAIATSEKYRHVPTGTLAILAQRLGKVSASPPPWLAKATPPRSSREAEDWDQSVETE